MSDTIKSGTVERIAELRLILNKRRREVLSDVQGRLRDGRLDGPDKRGDEADRSDAEMQGDVALALLQMKTETLARVDEALVRLDQGKYGACVECAQEISGRRLYALPFAVRCQPCEDRREREHLQRLAAERRSGASRFSGVTGA